MGVYGGLKRSHVIEREMLQEETPKQGGPPLEQRERQRQKKKEKSMQGRKKERWERTNDFLAFYHNTEQRRNFMH